MLVLLIGCHGESNKSSSPAVSEEADSAVSIQMKSLQGLIDELNKKEAEMRVLVDKVQTNKEIPESAFFSVDKGDLADSWSDVEEKFETFRQLVKSYYSLLQKELEDPAEPLSFEQMRLIEEISQISRKWVMYLNFLNETVQDLNSHYLQADSKYQIEEKIMADWETLYKAWLELSQELSSTEFIKE